MADIQTVSQVVNNNEHPVPQATQSVADMLRSMNLQQPNPDTQILEPADPGYEHIFATINGSPGHFIKTAVQQTPVINFGNGSDLMNSLPDCVGVPGATERIINPDTYENYVTEQQRYEAMQRDKLGFMAAAGAVAAVAIYFAMNQPKKRYS